MRGSKQRLPRFPSGGSGSSGARFPAFALICIASIGAPPHGPVPTAVAQDQGDVPESAVELARQIMDYREAVAKKGRPRDWYNLGTALLESGDLEGSRAALQRAAESGDEPVELSGHYNLGVADARGGRQRSRPGRERQGFLLAARDEFRDVLRAAPDDADARWNLELVERWLQEEIERSGGGGGAQGGAAGAQGGSGASPELTPEQADSLLNAAGLAEEELQKEALRRGRFRDPVVEKDW
jgi:tetratricopeptide (TPR) repeat protein